ncbi:uncharacterized protein LOC127870885 isoform X2 [Dreissena polymorpha]|nr:uncharacterized protein LOC127870885 isoform X2 [Dreissena polymorpha]
MTQLTQGNQPVNVLLETKGGPIQALAIHDITHFYKEDIITGDSVGMVTIFCNEQILSRHSLSKSTIKCLQIYTDALGNCYIVVADDAGYIYAIQPSKQLWRININNVHTSRGPLERASVTCMLCVPLPNGTGQLCSYILAADDKRRLHVISQGDIVMTIHTPDTVTAMCCGLFIAEEKLEAGPDTFSHQHPVQVALGCTSGALYILQNFTISEEEFGNAGCHISQMLSHPAVNGKIDYLLCAGHFSALQVFLEGKQIGSYETPNWVNCMDILCPGKDQRPQIVFACLDNSVHGVSLAEG